MSLQKKTDTEWITPLGWCLAIAFAVRILISVFFPASFRSDEIYQYFEPAFRLVSGHGVITWEWREGIRSWLVPGFIAALFKFSDALGLGFSLGFVRIVFAFFSLPLVGVSVWFGWRVAKKQGAWLFGLGMALWPDIAYGGIRPLGEYFGGNAIVTATILTVIAIENFKENDRSYFIFYLCGFLFGIGAIVRFQFAPAALFYFIFLFLKVGIKPFYRSILSFSLPIILLGFVDFETLGYPFQSIFKNYYFNSVLGVANNFGREPFLYFVTGYAKIWGFLGFVILILCFVKNNYSYFPILMSLFILIYHSLIAHKELSFVYPSIALIIFTSIYGLLYYIENRFKIKFINAVILEVAACLLLFYGSYENALIYKNYPLSLEHYASKQDMCGLAILDVWTKEGNSERISLDPIVSWADFGGYSYMKKNTPLYLFTDLSEVYKNKGSYSHIIAISSLDALYKDIKKIKCKGDICLYKVFDSCTQQPDFDQFSNALLKLGNK
ncbi:glycosyltransferase family protein [Komagataeibacter xylinus]|uniref:hypothetical protein n=1 Tax=Komagataeibacter xylinus TaxID=28448 RepID=UPI000FDF9B29|nr:hypothetical protein [Komagataeibacter xylinus]AZV39307.1 hypothetical protein CXP35_11450 [Komagataeibacter xylinus]